MLELHKLCKNFSSFQALIDVNFEVEAGEFLCLLGPSGCGKTTLLRIIAGLEKPTAGQIRFDKKNITEEPAHLRPFHTVFQRYALFPHMSVLKNISYPLSIKKKPKEEIDKQVEWALNLVQLPGYDSRGISTLSGGQQQRIALARCLAGHPRILLLDEPLSALDPHLRKSMQSELRELQKKLGITFIMVTHDQDEAFGMASRIVLMKSGQVQQIGKPCELYQKPANMFVAEFLGASVIIPVENLSSANAQLNTGEVVKIPPQEKSAFENPHLLLRPEWLKWSADTTSQANNLEVQLKYAAFHGSRFECYGRLKNGLDIRWSQNSEPRGAFGYLTWSPDAGQVVEG